MNTENHDENPDVGTTTPDTESPDGRDLYRVEYTVTVRVSVDVREVSPEQARAVTGMSLRSAIHAIEDVEGVRINGYTQRRDALWKAGG